MINVEKSGEKKKIREMPLDLGGAEGGREG